MKSRGRTARSVGAGLRAVPAADRTPRRRGWLPRLAGMLVALMLMAGTVVAVSLTAAPAKAFDFACAVGGGEAANTGPETEGLGSNFWLPKSRIPGTNDDGIKPREHLATLWELVGNRGLLWSYSPKIPSEDSRAEFNYNDSDANFEDACSPVDASAGYLAQLMFEPSRFLGGLTIGLKELAIGSAPFENFYDERNELLDVLRIGIFQPALIIGVMASGLWVMFRFRRQDDQRETYSGIIWSAVIVVLVSAALFGNNMQTLSRVIDTRVDDFNEAALESTTSLTARGQPPMTSPCRLLESVGNEGARRSSCMLYEMLLFNPWALGQFGTSKPVIVNDLCYDRDDDDRLTCEHGNPPRTVREKNQRGWVDGCVYSPYRCQLEHFPFMKEGQDPKINLAIQQVIAQAYTHNEGAGEAREPTDTGDEYDAYEHLWRNVQFAVADEHSGKYMMWKGSEPTSRMATAVSTLLINVIMLLAVGLVALLTVFWHGVMFVAWILLPLVGAVAAFPPARRVFMGYFGIVVQAVFLRMVLGLVLVVLLGIMNAINIADGSTGLKVILMIIAAAAMWKLLTALRNGQAGPSVVRDSQDQGMLPSDRRMTTGMSQAAQAAGRRTGRFTVGATAGGVRGARAGYTVSDRRGWGRVVDTVRGGRRGAVSGGASTTRTGRQKHWSEAAGEAKSTEAAWRDKWRRQQRKNPDPDDENV